MRKLSWLGCFIGLLAITRGALADQVRVDVDGVSGEVLDNVLLLLRMEQLTGRQSELTARAIQRAHSRAVEDITLALQPFGFYQPTVQTDLQKVSQTRQGEQIWQARYQIQAGPRVAYRHIEIDLAHQERAWPESLGRPDFTVGAPLSHPAYEQQKNTLINSAYDQGFLDAKFQRAELKIYPELRSADVARQVAFGEKFTFG